MTEQTKVGYGRLDPLSPYSGLSDALRTAQGPLRIRQEPQYAEGSISAAEILAQGRERATTASEIAMNMAALDWARQQRSPDPGTKYDAGKPPLDLMEMEYVEEIANVLAFGARKYEAHNWRKGIAVTRNLAAALRHVFKVLRGEDIDPESGLHHLAHAGCCLMFAWWTLKYRPKFDDRWRDGNA